MIKNVDECYCFYIIIIIVFFIEICINNDNIKCGFNYIIKYGWILFWINYFDYNYYGVFLFFWILIFIYVIGIKFICVFFGMYIRNGDKFCKFGSLYCFFYLFLMYFSG